MSVSAARVKAVLLTMQGIGGEQHAGQAQLGDQRRHGRDLAGRPGHLPVGQDEGGVTGKRAEHMSRFPVVQVIEAAAQRLAIERDGALPGHLDGPVQLLRMAAEGALEIVLVERQEQTAQRVHGRRPSEARPEGSVQAVALDGDEGDDLLVGGRPRQNRENREQQQMAQAIALPLRAAWIADFVERGKQRTKRHQGDLHQLRMSLQQIRYRTLRVPALGRVGSGRRGRTAWPWVSDGYAAYRSFKKRQRCLAHLIRKGVALASGLNPVGVNFGDWLLREMRGLIHEVAEGTGARLLNPMLARLKRACKLHRDDEAEKVRALAREILNDWTAITAFVTNPDLPATNNEAERALRDAVIARRISNGTRTEEGSAAYAATLSVFETCRRRGVEPWRYITDLLARARKSLPHISIPLPA